MENKSHAVVCKDKKTVEKIRSNINDIVKNQIDQHATIDDSDRERLYKRFVEVSEIIDFY